MSKAKYEMESHEKEETEAKYEKHENFFLLPKRQ